MSVLTDGKRVSVINAPAGAGKTWVLVALGRAWEQAGLGRVIGVTPSQSARNTLAAGVAESYNSAQILGHLPGQRGARSPVPAGMGRPLLLVDEASMMPRYRRPARRAHPDSGAAHSRGGAMDQGPDRRTPELRRKARRPAEPDDSVRRPRLRPPRPGVPVLVGGANGRDLAASEAGDPSLGPGAGARPGPRRRHGGGRLTVARCMLDAKR